MNKCGRLRIALGSIVLFSIIVGGIYEANKFIEKHQDSSFNYLAIGNSITKHGICEYWWNEIGMAASREQNDYVHLVAERLGTDVEMYALNFYIWEIQSADRAETLTVLEPYLSQNLNLVTVQLGENVTDRDTLEQDYEELIQFIQDRCPNAQIMLVGEFWEDLATDGMKKAAASCCGIDFVDLSPAWNNAEYMVGLGATVYDADGKKHIVEHEGVATHPGDEGMKFIAECILEFVKVE